MNPPRIDRHECRRKAIEFLTKWDDSRGYTEGEVEREIARFIRQRPNGWDCLSYSVEILRGLLGPKRGLTVVDRWIMGILAEDVQRSLGPGELSVLRWAAFELLTHPNIPTTVIINEANQVAKQFCPQQSSLIHAAVNRMIETQSSIGAELSSGGVPFIPLAVRKDKTVEADDILARFPPLDPQAQLALLLMERREVKKKSGDVSEDSEDSEDREDLKQRRRPVRRKVSFSDQIDKARIVEPLTKDAYTQTVSNPQDDSRARVVELFPDDTYSSDSRD